MYLIKVLTKAGGKRIAPCQWNWTADVLLLLVLTPALLGQAFTCLSGAVTDPTGAVIPGAILTITNTHTGVQWSSISNAAGRYSFSHVPPGDYELLAKCTGFVDVQIKGLELLVNSPATADIRFEKLGAIAETVQVEAAATQLNTTDASLGNAVTSDVFLQLPFFARDIMELLMIQPGVTLFAGGDFRSGAVNGGKPDQANITLDGADVNEQVTRAAFASALRVTLDSVQEFRTTTTNGTAESGRGSGADTALVTKSGTNSFHGSVYEYNRNELFAANGFFNNRTGIRFFGSRVQ
jgi:hypothetical protein